MNKIYEDRLLALATYLREEVPDDRFNMGHWGKTAHPCRSSACAIGWATNIFRGFTLQHYSGSWWPAYKGLYGWDAVTLLFGLNDDESGTLFGTHLEGESRHRVAERIEGFVLAE